MPTADARALLLSALLLPLAAHASRRPSTFDGYVTNISSATEFDVGPRHILCNAETSRFVLTEGASPGIVDVNLHVGTHVHVEGSFAKGTGVFTAKVIQILPTPASIEKAKIEGAGLIQELPQLHKDGQHWIGMLWIDGYPLQLTEQTKITSPDGSAFPADRIGTNFWAEYRAERQEDHSLRATSIQVVPLHIAADEVKFRESSEPVIERPDYTKKVPGKIKWRLNWALNILPERAIQDYVAGVGSRLIPQYQKSLPASDPAKIDFQFYVVQQPSKWKEALWAGAINEASATAGGLVFLPDTVLAVMDNEAQLAAPSLQAHRRNSGAPVLCPPDKNVRAARPNLGRHVSHDLRAAAQCRQ